jgi:hypothetical protein
MRVLSDEEVAIIDYVVDNGEVSGFPSEINGIKISHGTVEGLVHATILDYGKGVWTSRYKTVKEEVFEPESEEETASLAEAIKDAFEIKQCNAFTKSGNQCKNEALPDSNYCYVKSHQAQA